jgi:Vitamin K-dependent gamma-carboxylase
MTGREGWVLRITQVAVIATYFLSAMAKLRFGSPGWLTSATLEWAIIRRGTPLTDLLTPSHWILVAAHFGIVAFELSSPIVFFVRPRVRCSIIAYFYLFHAMVMATITISFAPHQAAMTSFLPLKKVRPIVWSRRLVARVTRQVRQSRPVTAELTGEANTPASHPAVDAGYAISTGTPATPAIAPGASPTPLRAAATTIWNHVVGRRSRPVRP